MVVGRLILSIGLLALADACTLTPTPDATPEVEATVAAGVEATVAVQATITAGDLRPYDPQQSCVFFLQQAYTGPTCMPLAWKKPSPSDTPHSRLVSLFNRAQGIPI